MNHKDWDLVNRRLVAKMLSELEYEQVFHAESQGDDRYCINLPGAQWRFIAERGIWGWLWIDAQTLRCADGSTGSDAADAAKAGTVNERCNRC